MKKIILIIFLFLLSGCYDYNEINNLAIVTAIGVDYQDDKYLITLEVLNDQADKEPGSISSYIKTGSDESLAKAIEDAADKLSDQANYTHVKLMIIGEDIVTEHFEMIIDFFMRSTYFRENFYIISAINSEPEELLKNTSEENPIASTAIIDMLKSLDYSSNSAVLKTFDEVVEEILAFGKDTCFSNIALDDEQFIIDGLTIFDDYEYKTTISNFYATIYNILTANFYRPIFSKTYDEKYFSIAITEGEVNIDIDTNAISLNGNLTGKIMDNEPNYSIRNLDVLEKINNDFTDLLNEHLEDFIKILQDNKSDILSLAEKYYHQTRIKNSEFWIGLKVSSNISFYINKKGLIYEVQNED